MKVWRWWLALAAVVAGMMALALWYITVTLDIFVHKLRTPEPADYPPLLYTLGIVAVAALAMLGLNRPRPAAAPATFGSGGFAELTDTDISDLLEDLRGGPLRRLLHRGGTRLIEYAAAGWLVLGTLEGRHVVLSPELSCRHGLIVGPTGAGKSRKEMMPNAAASLGSLIVSDPKGELWEYTSGYHDGTPRDDPVFAGQTLAAQAVRYAPSDPDRSAAFNVVPLCRQPRVARMVAEALLAAEGNASTQDFYVSNEQLLLIAMLVHVAWSAVPTLVSVYNLLGLDAADLLAMLQQSPQQFVRRVAAKLVALGEYATSMVSNVATKLEWLEDEGIRRFVGADLTPPDFSRLKHEPIAVYLCITPDDIAYYPRLITLFWTIVMQQLGGAAGPVPVLLLLDEFGNLGRIPNFVTRFTLARAQGIGIWLGLQDLAMLRLHYTPEEAETIVNGSTTRLALPGLAGQAAVEFSAALGEATVRHTTTSRSGGGGYGNVTESMGYHGRPVLTPDEVRRLPDDKILAIVGNRRPVLIDAVVYDRPPCTAKSSPLGEEQGLDARQYEGIAPRRSSPKKGSNTAPPPPPMPLTDLEHWLSDDESQGRDQPPPTARR